MKIAGARAEEVRVEQGEGAATPGEERQRRGARTGYDVRRDRPRQCRRAVPEQVGDRKTLKIMSTVRGARKRRPGRRLRAGRRPDLRPGAGAAAGGYGPGQRQRHCGAVREGHEAVPGARGEGEAARVDAEHEREEER